VVLNNVSLTVLNKPKILFASLKGKGDEGFGKNE